MEVFIDEWNVIEKSDVELSSERIKLANWFLTRKSSTTDSFVWVKVNCTSPFEKIKINKLSIHSNARFVELYYVQDTAVEYLTTLRGATSGNKFIFEIDHNTPLQFNQLHLKFLSIKNHSVEQTPGSMELKINSIEMTVSQSSYDVANTKYLARNAGGARSDSGASDKSDSGSTTTESQTVSNSPAPGQLPTDSSAVSNSENLNVRDHSISSTTQSNNSNQRMDARQMLLMNMNKPSPIPSFMASSQSNDTLIQLMLQMKTSLLSDIGTLLDTKLLPIANRLEKLESFVSVLKNKLDHGDKASKSNINS